MSLIDGLYNYGVRQAWGSSKGVDATQKTKLNKTVSRAGVVMITTGLLVFIGHPLLYLALSKTAAISTEARALMVAGVIFVMLFAGAYVVMGARIAKSSTTGLQILRFATFLAIFQALIGGGFAGLLLVIGFFAAGSAYKAKRKLSHIHEQ